MLLSKSIVSELVAGLNSGVPSEEKASASRLDALLYPSYGDRGLMPAEMFLERHFAALRGSEALDPLLDAARSGKPFARTYALVVLGAVREMRALPLAIDALGDSSTAIRLAATKSLWFLRQASAVPALVGALDDSDCEVRCSVARTLGWIRSPDAVSPLMNVCSGKADWRLKAAAVSALGEIGDPGSLPLVREALLAGHRKVREAAKSALSCYDSNRRYGRMKSYACQNLPPERIKQLAAEFSDEEVRASLGEDQGNIGFIFEPPDGPPAAMFWNALNGVMVLAIDDAVRAYAYLDYFRGHRYPCLHSFEEVEAYAAKHGWREGSAKTSVTRQPWLP